MAWWGILYLILFGVLAVAGIGSDYHDRRPAWFLGCAVLANLTIMYLFVAYWYPQLRAPLGLAAPLMLVASMGWEIFQEIQDLHGPNTDPELWKGQHRLTAILTALVCAPAFVVAGIAAFRT